MFDSVEIDTPQGTLTIEAERESPESIFVDKMELGGKKLNSYRISHDDLINGKNLKFNLKNVK